MLRKHGSPDTGGGEDLSVEFHRERPGGGDRDLQRNARVDDLAGGVGRLVLFHHDPSHDDWEIARIEAETPMGKVKMVNLRATIPGARPERIIFAGHYDTKLFRQFRFVGNQVWDGELRRFGGGVAIPLRWIIRRRRHIVEIHVIRIYRRSGLAVSRL